MKGEKDFKSTWGETLGWIGRRALQNRPEAMLDSTRFKDDGRAWTANGFEGWEKVSSD